MLECLILAQFPQILSSTFRELFLALKFSLLLKIIWLHGSNSEFQTNFNSCVSGEVTTSNEFFLSKCSRPCTFGSLFQKSIHAVKDSIKCFFSFWAQELCFYCISALFYLHFKTLWYRLPVNFRNVESAFYSLAPSSDLYSFITWP